MESIVINCSACGAALDVRANRKSVFCQYCGEENEVPVVKVPKTEPEPKKVKTSPQPKAEPKKATTSSKTKTEPKNTTTSAQPKSEPKTATKPTSVQSEPQKKNDELEVALKAIEAAFYVKDYDKTQELIQAAFDKGLFDYRIHIYNAKLNLQLDDNLALFSSLEALRDIEKNTGDEAVTEAIEDLMYYRGTNGVTALHNATFHEKLDLVKYCVEHYADVNSIAGGNRVTPLSIMYVPVDGVVRNQQNVERIREYLLSVGAEDVSFQTNNNSTNTTPKVNTDTSNLIRTSGKRVKKVSYLLLAFLFGSFGIHKFYAGKKGWGVIYLIVTLITMESGAPITMIASIIDILVAVFKKSDYNGYIYF